VQALYQVDLSGERPEAVCREFNEHRLAQLFEPFDVEEPSPDVDREWFEILVKGAWAARMRLDPEIERCLADGWTLAAAASSCAPACAPAASSWPSGPTCRSRS
jgi:transcription termination factor NusB